MAYTPEQRLSMVRMHLRGSSLREVSRKYKCDRKELAEWVRRYKVSGVEGILRKKNICATFELRCQIVEEHIEKGVTYTELCEKYNVSRASLKKWVRLVKQQGYTALTDSRKIKKKNDE